MVTALTFNNFFSKYITDPLSRDLSATSKIVATASAVALAATVSAVALAILTFAIIIPLVNYYKNRSIVPLTPSLDGTQPAQTAAKTQGAQPFNAQHQFGSVIEAIRYALKNNKQFTFIVESFTQERRESELELDLKQDPVTPGQLKLLGFIFPKMKSLVLGNSNITNEHLLQLKHFKNLESLNLKTELDVVEPTAMSLKDEQIALLAQIPKLDSLRICGHRELTGKTFNQLPTSLTSIFASHCNFNDEALSNLAHLTKLYFLVVYANSGITGATFAKLPPSLRALYADKCAVDPASLTNLAHLETLRTLNLNHNPAITGKNLVDLPSSLVELELINCPLTDETIEGLQHLQHLESLDLGGMDTLTGQTFDKLPTSIKRLNVYCPKLQSEGLSAKIKHLVNLEFLRLPEYLKDTKLELPANCEIKF